MRTFKVFSVLLLFVLLFTACTPAATAQKELKVAILAPLSGSQPTFGVSTRDGALLAIDQWNAKGGVLGMKVVPQVEDSQCSADPALNAAKKVIDQDNIHYIVGEVCSSASIPVSDYANPKKVIQISPTSTNVNVTVENGKLKDYIFRACFIDPFQGKVGAKFAFENLKAKTAFVLLDQGNDYVKGLAEAFSQSFTDLGGKVVGTESYVGKSDTDFSAILSKVADAKPDVVYLPDYYNVVNLVTKQAKEKGITAPFMGGDGWDSSDLDVNAAAGGYYTNHYSPDDPRPEVQNFVKDYGAKYKDDKGNPKVPDALATLAYDATNLMLQAITNAGADDTTKVKTALEGINFKAVSGTITFDKDHNPIKSATLLKVTPQGVKFEAVVNP